MSGSASSPYSYYDSNGKQRNFNEDDRRIIITFKPADAEQVIDFLSTHAPKASIEGSQIVDAEKGKEKITISYLNKNTGFARLTTPPGSAFNSTMETLASPESKIIIGAMPALQEEKKKIINYLPGREAIRLKKELIQGYYFYEKYKEPEDKDPEETKRLVFKSDYRSHAQKILDKYNLKIEKVAFSPGLFSVSFPKSEGIPETQQLFTALKKHGKLEPKKESPAQIPEAEQVDAHQVGFDAELQGAGSPNDLSPSQWGVYTTGNYHANVLAAWNVTHGYLYNVHVAVLDTGVDVDHPDIRIVGGLATENKIRKKYNAINGLTSYSEVDDDDPNSHGTNVAGIIGALTNNGVGSGIAGIAYDCGLYIVRIADPSLATLCYLDVVAGIDDVTATAIDEGPTPGTNLKRYVMNLSFKLDSDYGLVATAITDAYDACVVIVAAAGESASGVAGVNINNPGDEVWPACYPEVIPVAAHQNLFNTPRTNESNYGNGIKQVIRAPGKNIPTTQRGGSIQNKSQTSIAAGFVSGAAALCWSHIRMAGFPNTPGGNVTKRDSIYTNLYLVYAGSGGGSDAGRLNVYNAVNAPT